MRSITCKLLLMSTALAVHLSAASISIFNTGVDGTNALLPAGTVDPHYSLTQTSDAVSGPGPNAYVANSNVFPLPSPWLANGPNSSWLTPNVNNNTSYSGGTYTYTTTFNLSGYIIASAILSGQWAADNGGSIRLNGIDVTTGDNGVMTGEFGYNHFTTFFLDASNATFVEGQNVLEFIVSNINGPTGVRVEIAGTADPLTGNAVPEPGSSALIGLGLAGFAATLRRVRTNRCAA